MNKTPNDNSLIRCSWPVSDEHPSKSDGSDCPEPRCELYANHTSHHSGQFKLSELQKVERPN